MTDIHVVARLAIATAWIYQGLVPKVLFPNTGELEIFRSTGIFPGKELTGVVVLGVAQFLLGVYHLVAWRSRAPLWAGLGSLAILGAGGLITRPDLMILPFNPVSLILMMAALSAIDLARLREERTG